MTCPLCFDTGHKPAYRDIRYRRDPHGNIVGKTERAITVEEYELLRRTVDGWSRTVSSGVDSCLCAAGQRVAAAKAKRMGRAGADLGASKRSGRKPPGCTTKAPANAHIESALIDKTCGVENG